MTRKTRPAAPRPPDEGFDTIVGLIRAARQATVAPLVTQLPWTHNLIVLGQSKRPEEREFYLRMAIREQWSSRDLERQFRTSPFERVVCSRQKCQQC